MNNESDFYFQLAERWGLERKEAKWLWIKLWFKADDCPAAEALKKHDELEARQLLQGVWKYEVLCKS